MKSFRTDNFQFIDFTEMDEELSHKVWECRNHPDIRANMSNRDPIRFADHLNFVSQLTHSHNTLYYCVLLGRVFIGSVNIHFLDKETVERGIYIAPQFWGQGLSKLISKEFYQYIHNNRGVNIIKTRVYKSNGPSNALQYSIGARLIATDDEYNYYQLDLR